MAILSEKLSWNDIVKVSNIILKYYTRNKCSQIQCKWLYNLFNEKHEALLRNKILTPLAYILYTCCNYCDDAINFRIHRHQVYMKAARELSFAFRSAGIKLAIIKTIKPLPIDVADIDIVVDPVDKTKAIKILRELGYRIRKDSLEQDLWSKVVDDIIVDVELHTSIALAGFQYLDNKYIFSNTTCRNDICVPNAELETILETAHAIIKDLEIRLSDIYSVALLLQRISKSKHKLALLVLNAKALGLTLPLTYMTKLVGTIYAPLAWVGELLSHYAILPLPVARFNYMPHKPPLYLLVMSLLEKTSMKIMQIGFRKTVKEIATLLKSKGTVAVLSYITGKTVTKGVFEDLASY